MFRLSSYLHTGILRDFHLYTSIYNSSRTHNLRLANPFWARKPCRWPQSMSFIFWFVAKRSKTNHLLERTDPTTKFQRSCRKKLQLSKAFFRYSGYIFRSSQLQLLLRMNCSHFSGIFARLVTSDSSTFRWKGQRQKKKAGNLWRLRLVLTMKVCHAPTQTKGTNVAEIY